MATFSNLQSIYKYKNIEYIMKRTIRLREQDLHKVISESVKRAITEWDEYDFANFKERHANPQVEELIQKTLSKLPVKALNADAYVVPIIRGAIKRAYDLGCTGNEQQ